MADGIESAAGGSRRAARGGGTLFERIWDAHLVREMDDGLSLIHVDRHMIHEVSSAMAFLRLARRGRRVRNPELCFAMPDHIVSTMPGRMGGTFAEGAELVDLLREHCRESGITLFDLDDPRHGIVHVVACEQGIALPGCTLVCGDSHTSTVGGLGALGWGVGTSDIEQVLATQTILRRRPRSMRVRLDGRLGAGVSAKDLILNLIGRTGTAGAAGHVVEYAGPAIDALSVEGRMTVCNMSVELGARAGLVAPDDRTLHYLAGRPFSPRGAGWDAALVAWRRLRSDDYARFDRELGVDCADLAPQVTWGTSPEDVLPVDGRVPDPAGLADHGARTAAERSLAYMGLVPGTSLQDVPVDVVFVGSCTNGRLDDLEEAARLAEGRQVAPGVRALVVPGSRAVREAAVARGLDGIFKRAGFEWREAGCSMCLALNDDRVPAGARAVSTSNRNFEGRQGAGARTHLASPATAVASAIAGRIADPRRIGA